MAKITSVKFDNGLKLAIKRSTDYTIYLVSAEEANDYDYSLCFTVNHSAKTFVLRFDIEKGKSMVSESVVTLFKNFMKYKREKFFRILHSVANLMNSEERYYNMDWDFLIVNDRNGSGETPKDNMSFNKH